MKMFVSELVFKVENNLVLNNALSKLWIYQYFDAHLFKQTRSSLFHAFLEKYLGNL